MNTAFQNSAAPKFFAATLAAASEPGFKRSSSTTRRTRYLVPHAAL
jgi:hypothetical protein